MLGATRNLARASIVGVLILGYALLAHWTATRAGHATLGALLALGPVGFFALVLAWRSLRAVGVAAWLLAAVLMATHWKLLQAHFVWIYLIQQVGLYSLLAVAFGRTLAAEGVPLCTQVALRVHGALGADARRYTRQVTVAWTLFFAMTACAFVILFFSAPLRVWSAFANFGAPMAIVLMFAAESRIRRLVLPGIRHADVITTVRASAAVGLGTSKPQP